MASRDGWIYGGLFVAILAAGGFLIVPRVLRLQAPDGPRTRTPASRPPPALPPAPAPREPVARWFHLRVEGPDGSALRGPLKPVEGADARLRNGRTAARPEVDVRPTSPQVFLGAAGHQWREIDAASLADGQVVRLEAAAPPLIVRVREADGLPAPGIPVHTVPLLPDGPVRTDSGGAVVLDALAPGLVVVEVGGRERRGPTLRLLAGKDRDVQATLEPAWTLRGRVTDGHGQPVPNADVSAFDEGGRLGSTPRTAADGTFRWVGPVSPLLVLSVEAEGFAPRHVEARPPPSGPLDVDVGDVAFQARGASLAGRVLSAIPGARSTISVEPAAAAIVRELFGPSAALVRPAETVTGPDGTFRIDDLPPGLPLRVSVRGGGIPFDDRVTLEPGPPVAHDYTPRAGASLGGTVTDRVTGRPAAGVLLRVARADVDLSEPAPGDVTVETGPSGTFRVDGLEPGRVWLRAFVAGRRPLLVATTLPLEGPLDLALQAEEGRAEDRIQGRVTDDMDVPLEGVVVRASGRSSRTDENGHFVLDDVAGFSGSVWVSAGFEPGTTPEKAVPAAYVPGIRREIRPGGPPVKLVLARAAQLTFRALDGVDDRPLAYVHVLLRTQDGFTEVDRPVATVDGVVELRGLLPVGATLSLFTTRHRASLGVVLHAGRAEDVGTLRLSRGMHIEGRVLDPSGTGVPGARVAGVEPGWILGRDEEGALARELLYRSTVGDAHGHFSLDGMDPRQPAVLAVWGPGFAPSSRRVVLERFKDDVRVVLDTTLREGGTLAVDLIESHTGDRVTGALFDLEDARNGADHLDLVRRGVLGSVAGSDEDWRYASEMLLMEREPGRYRIGPVEPGPYDVWVNRPGYAPARKRLTVLDPSEALTDLREGTSRRLTGALSLVWELDPDS